MLEHEAKNRWQVGLLSLFGYMDSTIWTVLWSLAAHADDNGHCRVIDTQLINSLQRNTRNFHWTMAYIKKLGLVRVARKRASHIPVQGQHPVELHCRVIELYQGIQYGKIPAGSNYPLGLMPEWFKRGRNCSWQTHNLMRKKFKPKLIKPNYKDYTKLSRMELRKLVPSARYQRKLERKKVEWLNRAQHTRYVNWALKRKWM